MVRNDYLMGQACKGNWTRDHGRGLAIAKAGGRRDNRKDWTNMRINLLGSAEN